MFEIDGKSYELHYSLQRIRLIEVSAGDSLMGLLQRTNGALSISTLCTAFAYGLKDVSTGFYVPPQTGLKFAEDLIQKEGFANLNVVVIGKIQEDCPFFFQVD